MKRVRWFVLMVAAVPAAAASATESLWPSDRAPQTVDGDFPPPLVQRVSVEEERPTVPPVESPAVAEPRAPEQVFTVGEGAPVVVERERPLQVSIASYGWLPEVYGQLGLRTSTTEFGLSTREMLNLLEHNVHFLFAAQMEVDYGPFSITSSGFYIYSGFGTTINRLSFSGNSSLAIVDAALGYEIEGLADTLRLSPGSEIEVLVGGRYWLLGGGVSVSGPMGNTFSRGNDVDWVDPVVGGRVTYALGDDARLRVRGDYGGFGWWRGSEETWNVEAMFEKRCAGCLTLGLGYRILSVDYTRGNSFERFAFDAEFRGPLSTLAVDF